jgi:tRNA threonylcarbamoyladenosine biosynthesis protein TsaB
LILLGVDTCGATGSIAFGRVESGRIAVLGEMELAGGEYAASLVKGIAGLLDGAQLAMRDLAGIVVVVGPGSFTGIRIGLSTVKALAEAAGLPVVAISRLALLAAEAGLRCAALDAHRGQFFLGVYPEGEAAREVLMTAGEFTLETRLPGPVAFCEEATAHLLETVVTDVELVRTPAPTAAAAISFGLARWQAGEFADVATLDGYYLRGADARTSAQLLTGRS